MEYSWSTIIIMCVLGQITLATSELAVLSCNKLKLHYKITQGWKSAKLVNFVYKHLPLLLISTVILSTLIIQTCSEAISQFYIAHGIHSKFISYIQSMFLIIFIDIIPIILGHKYADVISYWCSPVLVLPIIAVYPVYIIFYMIKQFLIWLSPVLKYIFPSEKYYMNHTYGELAKIFYSKTYALQNLGDPMERISYLMWVCEEPVSKYMLLIKQFQIGIDYTKENIIHKFHILKVQALPVFKNKQLVGILKIGNVPSISSKFNLSKLLDSPWLISDSTSLLSVMEAFHNSKEHIAIVMSKDTPIGIVHRTLITSILSKEYITHTPMV